jgi:integrase
MARRRSNGEGSIRRRGTGWEARITYTDPITGERKRESLYGPTAAAVRAKMAAARRRIDAGAPVRDATGTVADWLNHWCATTLAASDRKESTKELYAGFVRKHLCELLGVATLDKLRPSDIERLILACRDRGLSDSSVRSCYSVLRLALDGAVRDGLIGTNPAARVARPPVPRTEARYLTDDDAATLLAAAENSRFYPALSLIAATGLRRGECLALSWDQVNFDTATIKVVATISRIHNRLVISAPKTPRSRRIVPLSPAMVAMLRRHKTTQNTERLRAGARWTDSGLVFATKLGAPVEPRHLLAAIETAADKAGLPDVTVHTLRHSAAVGWLEAGVHIKAVADLLGHSSIAITGDIYGHTSVYTARAAIDDRAARLGL